jgi:L-threonylcarbamoyladenylate synthase
VELLRQGEVVGLPTETVYGLAADALNARALARIFEIKHRPFFDPLIVHVRDSAAAWELAHTVPDLARALAQRFWPGPLTLVLPKREIVPDLATSGRPCVALRVPAHPVAQALLQAFGGPLAAPSANRFGRISPTDAAAVFAELGEAVPLILDGGPCGVGLESTVLDLSGEAPILLRAGGVPLEEIEKLAGPIQRSPPVDDDPHGPGQLKHHYAPRKPLKIVASPSELAAEKKPGWLIFGDLAAASDLEGAVENLSPQGDLREAAAHFFRALRRLDDDPGVERIGAFLLPDRGLGRAINERLERAAHP